MFRGIFRFLLGLLQWVAMCLGAFFLGMVAAPIVESWRLDREASALVAEPGNTSTAPGRLSPGALLGRVQIARLDIDATVLEGTGESVLRRAVGHFPGTRLPWQPGTVGLAAHRDSFFRNLEHVVEGDVVRLVTEHGTTSYEVTGFRVVDPQDVQVLDDRETSGLTLVTCYPFHYLGAAPQRFVVLARRLENI